MAEEPTRRDAPHWAGDIAAARIDRNSQKEHRHELETAARLARLGFTVKFVRIVDGQPNPDVELGDGTIWELKSPTGSSADSIRRQFRGAGRQGLRLVLDLSRSPHSTPAAIREAEFAFARYTRWISAMIIREASGSVELLALWRR